MDFQLTHDSNTLQSFISDGTPEVIRERYASLVTRADNSDFGEFDSNVVVIDTETTGFSFSHDELTQIAAIRIEQGEIADHFVTYVNPGKPIPEEVALLTSIYDEDVASAPSPSEALADLALFVGDAKIVAHNTDFDRTFVTRHPSGYSLLENTWIDSLDLARIALPRLTSHRLVDLACAFGVPILKHHADGDAEATCSVFRILLAAVDAMPPILVQAIAHLTSSDRWSTQVLFEYFSQRNASSDSISASKPDSNLAHESSKKLNQKFSFRKLRRKETNFSRANVEAGSSDEHKTLQYPTSEEITEAFSETGLVGKLYADFEPRNEQVAMAKAVNKAFATSENLVVEAGTGVGKSMAYLLPAALVAQKNNITVGVATKTNALLDQLVYHELPALSSTLQAANPDKKQLSYVSLKGFSHYPCLHRIERLANSGAQMCSVSGKELSQAPAIAGLLSFIEQTDYDDIDDLKIDYRTLPRQLITTTSNDCLKKKCPYYYGSCFVHGARRQAEQADVVVTNHSLLFCDLLTDGGLLPPIRYWIIDEAHGTEAEARKAFSLTLAAEDIVRIASRVDDAEAKHNVFSQLERHVIPGSNASTNPSDGTPTKTSTNPSDGAPSNPSAGTSAFSPDGDPSSVPGATLLYSLVAKARKAGTSYAAAAHEFVAHMKDLLYFDQNKRGRGYETVEVWINDEVRASETFTQIVSCGRTMIGEAEKLITASQELVAYLDDLNNNTEVQQIQQDIASLTLELKDQVLAAQCILLDASKSYAYSATLNRKKDRLEEKFEALLLNVGEKLDETLYAHTDAVVFTSATLAVGDQFDAFENALGLNKSENSACRTLLLKSSFDFDNQMTIYVVNDIPNPNDPDYLPALEHLLVNVHRAQQGSMLTLFTNRREMEKCFDEVQPQLKDDNLRVVCQRWGASVKGLQDDFRDDEHLSLFALKTFWEGFDAPGATLKGVIIPKLPFAKPTDPLSRERNERDEKAWIHYTLPAAVLETKQAAGRLIRKADDKGVLILADRRLLEKSYGKTFLDSMPSRTIKILTADEIAAEITQTYLSPPFGN